MSYQRPQGTLSRWYQQNNYGFIILDGFPIRANDVFVHLTAFQMAGIEPRVGIRISFDVGPSLKADKPNRPLRVNAINLTRRDANGGPIHEAAAVSDIAPPRRDAAPETLRPLKAVP